MAALATALGLAGLTGLASAPATAVTLTDASTPSALTGMWAWGNPIDPANPPSTLYVNNYGRQNVSGQIDLTLTGLISPAEGIDVGDVTSWRM